MPTRKISSNIHIKSSNFEYGDSKPMTNVLPPNSTYTCKVSYPFDNGFTMQVNAGDKGMTLKAFNTKLRDAYKRHYKAIDADKIDDGYWHGLDDLFLEGVDVNDDEKTIGIVIGS